GGRSTTARSSWAAGCRATGRRSLTRSGSPRSAPSRTTARCTPVKGTIVVKAKKAKIATKQQDAKRIKAQPKAASKRAKKLVAGQGVPTGPTVKAGNDKQGIAGIAFFPGVYPSQPPGT